MKTVQENFYLAFLIGQLVNQLHPACKQLSLSSGKDSCAHKVSTNYGEEHARIKTEEPKQGNKLTRRQRIVYKI